MRNIFGRQGCVHDVNTPFSPNASTIIAPQTSSVVQSVLALSRSLPVSEIKTKLMASLGLDSFALTAYLSNLHRESCTSYLLNDWDHQAFGPLSPEDAHRVCLLCSSQLTTMSTSGEHLPAPETAARPNNHMREITALLKAGKWSFEGSSESESGHCTAMGSGPDSVAAFTRALSSELDAMGLADEVIRGQYMRANIGSGPEMAQLHFRTTPARTNAHDTAYTPCRGRATLDTAFAAGPCVSRASLSAEPRAFLGGPTSGMSLACAPY
jgi:hypothetical protein